MRIYKGVPASPGLVLGQVSRLERSYDTFNRNPHSPKK